MIAGEIKREVLPRMRLKEGARRGPTLKSLVGRRLERMTLPRSGRDLMIGIVTEKGRKSERGTGRSARKEVPPRVKLGITVEEIEKEATLVREIEKLRRK